MISGIFGYAAINLAAASLQKNPAGMNTHGIFHIHLAKAFAVISSYCCSVSRQWKNSS